MKISKRERIETRILRARARTVEEQHTQGKLPGPASKWWRGWYRAWEKDQTRGNQIV